MRAKQRYSSTNERGEDWQQGRGAGGWPMWLFLSCSVPVRSHASHHQYVRGWWLAGAPSKQCSGCNTQEFHIRLVTKLSRHLLYQSYLCLTTDPDLRPRPNSNQNYILNLQMAIDIYKVFALLSGFNAKFKKPGKKGAAQETDTVYLACWVTYQTLLLYLPFQSI